MGGSKDGSVNNKAYAPYNFVPFSKNVEKVPKPYSSRSEIVGKADTKDADRISGYIEFDIKLETHLCIGGYRKDGQEMPFMDGNDRPVIPGSTVRGLVKSHVEMLSFSYPQIEEQRFMYRKFADTCKSVRDEYAKRLKGDANNRNPEGVKCGIIFKNEKGEYFIKVLKNFSGMDYNFIRVHEMDLRKLNALDNNQYMYRQAFKKFKLSEKTKNMNEGKEKLEKIRDEVNYYNKTVLKPIENKSYTVYRKKEKCKIKINENEYEGYLLNSEYIGGKTHHYLTSSVKSGEEIIVDQADIINYKKDYEKNEKLKKNKEFYGLPDRDGEENGKIFFYKINNDGKLLGFGPTQYFRIFYDRPVTDGIPYKDTEPGYDYTNALFGFIEKDDMDQNISMKSRLSFQNITADPVKEIITKDLELLSPKGTAFQLYLDQTGKNANNLNTYNSDSFLLRGYKVYLKRDITFEKQKEANDSDRNNNKKNNDKIKTKCAFLPSDKTNFKKGRIYYDNLTVDELGLLLLAVKYNTSDEIKESHLIGHGKPYGYGKTFIENVTLHKYDFEKRFTDPAWSNEGKDITDKIDMYKEKYKEKISGLLGLDINEFENIDTIRAYRGYIVADNMCENSKTQRIYMPLNQKEGGQSYNGATYKDRCILPNWDQIMKNLKGC